MLSNNITLRPLSDPETASSLRSLHRLLLSSLGPHGSLRLIPGGATSCSTRLLDTTLINSDATPSVRAMTKVVVSAARDLSDDDGALWCAAMTLGLVQGHEDGGGAAMSWVGSTFVRCLEEGSFVLDLSGIAHLRTMVESVLVSKPGPGLAARDRTFLTGLILEAFLGLVPEPGSTRGVSAVGKDACLESDVAGMDIADKTVLDVELSNKNPTPVHIHTNYSVRFGTTIVDERFVESNGNANSLHRPNPDPGMYSVGSPSIPVDTNRPGTEPDPGPNDPIGPDRIRLIFAGGQDVRQSRLFRGLLVKLTDPSSGKLVSSLRGGPVGTLLLTDSVPGEVPFRSYEGEMGKREMEQCLVEKEWRALQGYLGGARLLFCQKVVHPTLKKRLKRKGVLVLDRLGGETAKNLRMIIGSGVGTVSSVEEQTIGRDRFLLLKCTKLYSLFLCCYGEQPGQELMVVCRQAIGSLFRVMRSTRLSFGAGCAEVAAMEKLVQKLRSDPGVHTPSQVHASSSALLRALRVALLALHGRRPLGVAGGHLWRLDDPLGRCACGTLSVPSGEEEGIIYLSAWEGRQGGHGMAGVTPGVVAVLDEAAARERCFAAAFETASKIMRTTVLVDNSAGR